MKCEKCNKEAVMVLPYTQVGFCSKHFKQLTRKRVRLALKNYEMVEKGEKLGFLIKNTAASLTCPLLVKEILSSLPLEYVALSFNEKKEIRNIVEKLDLDPKIIKEQSLEEIAEEYGLDKLVIGRDLTHETDLFIKALMKNKTEAIKTLEPKTKLNGAYLINPMMKIPAREIRFFAEQMNLEFQKRELKGFEKEVHELIEKVKERRANTRFSILKMIEAIKEI